MYVPSSGFIGVDECTYEACAAYGDEETGEYETDMLKCAEAIVTIIVDACAPPPTPPPTAPTEVRQFYSFLT